jgi:hypothetical protein
VFREGRVPVTPKKGVPIVALSDLFAEAVASGWRLTLSASALDGRVFVSACVSTDDDGSPANRHLGCCHGAYGDLRDGLREASVRALRSAKLGDG